MVVFVLSVKADLEGVESLALIPGSNFCFSVRNPRDGCEIREKIVVDSSQLLEASQEHTHGNGHHKGEHHKGKQQHKEVPCHFALKWRDEPARATITILNLQDHIGGSVPAPAANKNIQSGTFVPMLAMECHGIEPYAFYPIGDEFVVTNKAGVKFEPVDLSSGDWSEYDISSGSTSITNLESKIE
jgi:hypothetical protein